MDYFCLLSYEYKIHFFKPNSYTDSLFGVCFGVFLESAWSLLRFSYDIAKNLLINMESMKFYWVVDIPFTIPRKLSLMCPKLPLMSTKTQMPWNCDQFSFPYILMNAFKVNSCGRQWCLLNNGLKWFINLKLHFYKAFLIVQIVPKLFGFLVVSNLKKI